jgi:hypothetical protein
MIFEVGKRAPYPYDLVQPREHAFLKHEKDNTFFLAVYLPNITEDVLNILLGNEIKTRYHRDKGFFLMVIHFSKSNLIFEVPMSYPQNAENIISLDTKNPVHFVFIDSESSVVRGLRSALPPEKTWMEYANALATFPECNDFEGWFDKMMRNSSGNLWGMGIDGGSFRE